MCGKGSHGPREGEILDGVSAIIKLWPLQAQNSLRIPSGGPLLARYRYPINRPLLLIHSNPAAVAVQDSRISCAIRFHNSLTWTLVSIPMRRPKTKGREAASMTRNKKNTMIRDHGRLLQSHYVRTGQTPVCHHILVGLTMTPECAWMSVSIPE